MTPPPLFRPALSRHRALLAAALALAMVPGGARAASHDEKDIPYWGGLRSDTVNMRSGPGEDYRVSWVYRRQHMPLKVLRAQEAWRLVEDPDGARGWVMVRFIGKAKDVMAWTPGLTPMRETADAGAKVIWQLEKGVIAHTVDCGTPGWCRVEVAGKQGYVETDRLWGTAPLK